MMDCAQWQSLLVDHLAGELEEDRAIQLEQHLAECCPCSAREEELRALMHEARARREWSAPEGMEERLLAVMRSGARRQPESVEAKAGTGAPWGSERAKAGTGAPWWHRPLEWVHSVPASAAAALFLLAGAGGFVLGSWTTGPGADAPGPRSSLGPERTDLLSASLVRTGHSVQAAMNAHSTRWPVKEGMGEPISRFSTAPSDAIRIPSYVLGDSL